MSKPLFKKKQKVKQITITTENNGDITTMIPDDILTIESIFYNDHSAEYLNGSDWVRHKEGWYYKMDNGYYYSEEILIECNRTDAS